MSFIRKLFQRISSERFDKPTTSHLPEERHVGRIKTLQPKVLCIIHNPTIRPGKDRKLSRLMNWNDPDDLAQRYISDLFECSAGHVRYEIVERIEIDGYPLKADGFAYNEGSYMDALKTQKGFHQPDEVDYHSILLDHRVVQRVNHGEIDELWLFAFPYAGYYESIMAGPGAFWCNAPPIDQTDHSSRRFIIMGFNYERGVGEMLENFGHRVESILSYVYRNHRGESNMWARFTRHEASHPGQAACGSVHFAPNSERDYDWGNRRVVFSSCGDWFAYPNLSGTKQRVTCAEWGNGDIRLHHKWWLGHLPLATGYRDGIANDWWAYAIDPNLVS